MICAPSCGAPMRSWEYRTKTQIVDVWHCPACGREHRKFTANKPERAAPDRDDDDLLTDLLTNVDESAAEVDL